MNSRGEQLEKHEILKAKCLEVLDKEDRYGFNLIWEACANMEKYIQYGFNTIQRDYIFGSDNSNTDKWNKLISQEAVFKQLKPNDTSKENIKTEVCIIDLLNPSLTQYNAVNITEEENPDRFNTIVNFSNFLLHILRIQTKENIALDDKRLIELFEPFLKDEANKNEFVKTFGYNILKGKFLFDKYIIKREFARGTDHWSLKRMKWNEQYKTISYVNSFGNEESNEDINREILMLLSMFHVSNPTLVYKHWLNAALKFVFENDNFTASEYKEYLENLAKAFLHDRFLSDESKDYFEIIYKNNGLSKNTLINISKLNQGTAVENFVFNYLDYLLWLDYRNEKQNFTVEGKTINDNRIKEFEYTFRSSVEHYYPQHPIEGNISIALTENEQNEGKIDWLNSFGNLCLISNSKNSRLSNYMPSAKKEHYNNSPTLDSVKQRIMMEYSAWDICGDNNINEIEDHDIKMKKLIIE